MDDNTLEPTVNGPSRRDVLRKSALVGGAVVWMAPAVQTLAGPAFATTSPSTVCTYRFFLKYDPATRLFSNTEGNGNENCVPVSCAGSQAVGVTNTTPLGTANLSVNGTPIGSVTGGALNVTTNCVDIDFNLSGTCNVDEGSSFFVFKDGGGAGCEVLTDSGSLTQVDTSAANDTYTICGSLDPGSENGGLISHLNLCICVKC